MSQHWFDRMKRRILRMRDRLNQKPPADISKDYSRSICFASIRNYLRNNERHPSWSILLDMSKIRITTGLQYHIKYHEKHYIRNPDAQNQGIEEESTLLKLDILIALRTFEAEADTNFVKKRPFKKKQIGAHAKFSNYSSPRNDKVMSKGKPTVNPT